MCSKKISTEDARDTPARQVASGLMDDDDISCATTTVHPAAPSEVSLSDPTVEWVRPRMDDKWPEPEDIFDILPRPSCPLQGGIFTQSPDSMASLEGRVPFDARVQVQLGECAVNHDRDTTRRLKAALKNELWLVMEGPDVGGLFCSVHLFDDDLNDVRHAILGFMFAFFRETEDGRIGLWPCATLKALDAEFVLERPVAAEVHAKLGAALLDKFADFHKPPVQFKDFRFVCDWKNTTDGPRFDCIEDGCFWLRVDSDVRKAAKMAREVAEKKK